MAITQRQKLSFAVGYSMHSGRQPYTPYISREEITNYNWMAGTERATGPAYHPPNAIRAFRYKCEKPGSSCISGNKTYRQPAKDLAVV